MPPKVINIYKKSGAIPLQVIKEIKKTNKELALLPMTYAGRLDPLAEGVLIVLVGDECLKKDEYLALDKEYEVEILFGFATDTYDVMGKVCAVALESKLKDISPETVKDFSWSGELDRGPEKSFTVSGLQLLQNAIPQFIGKFSQKYPPYSSRTVEGKPLYQWARQGKLSEIDIPSHEVYVKNIEILSEGEILGKELLEKIKSDIALVEGDFRQEEILTLWEKTLDDKKDFSYQTWKLRIICGSGVYVRAIANDLGIALGTQALALHIKRTRVGDFVC